MSYGATMEFLTLSYRGDYEVCRMLCESMDRFVPQDIQHRMVVPRADLELFSALASPRRRLVAEEDVLPRWFRRAPMPAPRWRKLLRLPRRNVYLTPFSMPVRGWIAQQIMKIAAAAASTADIVVHIDSDNAFIRPFARELITPSGRVRLYRSPSPAGHDTHVVWQHAAGRLLGLPDRAFYGGEYIDSFVIWKTGVVRGLIRRLEEVSGRNWVVALSRTPHFAEYVLYGIYAEHIAGFENAGLSPQPESLAHSMWEDGFDGEDAVQAFVEAVQPHHLSCLIQSTLSESVESRRAIFDRVTAAAARQDGKA